MNGNPEIQNKLNSFMDHVWDGFYSGQIRRSRFPGFIYGGEKGIFYDIVMTGTPAKRMQYKFITQSKTAGMTLRVAYPGSTSYAIEKDGEEVPYNAWDASLKDYGPVEQTQCGENRFVSGKNILEFYITAGCTL
jgi:hypothetical protein